jgi:hypothetical protein
MHQYIKLMIAPVAVAALLALLTACGATTPTDAPSKHSAFSLTKPVEEDVEIDRSESNEEVSLRKQYFAAAMKAVEVVLRQGGALTVKTYFSRGLDSVELLKTPVPTPDEASGVSRAEQVIPIREAAETAIAEALGLAPPRPEVAEALEGMGGEGTDVSGSLAASLAESDGAANQVVIQITDGEDARFIGHYGDSPGELAALISPGLPHVAPGGVIGMFGIGATANGTSTALNRRLVSAWRLACESTGARCFVSPSLDMSGLLGGSEGA